MMESGAKGRLGSAVRVIAFGRLWRLPGLPWLPGLPTAVADCDSAWQGAQKLKIGAAERPFRAGGVAKVGDPTPQNGHSAWEGSQNLYIGNLPIVRLWRLLPCKVIREHSVLGALSRTLDCKKGRRTVR